MMCGPARSDAGRPGHDGGAPTRRGATVHDIKMSSSRAGVPRDGWIRTKAPVILSSHSRSGSGRGRCC